MYYHLHMRVAADSVIVHWNAHDIIRGTVLSIKSPFASHSDPEICAMVISMAGDTAHGAYFCYLSEQPAARSIAVTLHGRMWHALAGGTLLYGSLDRIAKKYIGDVDNGVSVASAVFEAMTE